jgi:hypothetical protein
VSQGHETETYVWDRYNVPLKGIDQAGFERRLYTVVRERLPSSEKLEVTHVFVTLVAKPLRKNTMAA